MIYWYSEEQMDIARVWVMSVVSNPERVKDAPGFDVCKYIEVHYFGGWDAFVEECC